MRRRKLRSCSTIYKRQTENNADRDRRKSWERQADRKHYNRSEQLYVKYRLTECPTLYTVHNDKVQPI